MGFLARKQALQVRNVAGLLLPDLSKLIGVLLTDIGKLIALLLSDLFEFGAQGVERLVSLSGPGKLVSQKIVITLDALNDFLVPPELRDNCPQMLKLDFLIVQPFPHELGRWLELVEFQALDWCRGLLGERGRDGAPTGFGRGPHRRNTLPEGSGRLQLLFNHLIRTGKNDVF